MVENDDKNITICPGYCCLACVDGCSCPVALAEECAERCMDVIKECKDCPYYKGCEGCDYKGTNICIENSKK